MQKNVEAKINGFKQQLQPKEEVIKLLKDAMNCEILKLKGSNISCLTKRQYCKSVGEIVSEIKKQP